jgi:prephenate dehydrogenase
MFEQLGLLGCGLIGGSFALALKRAGLVKRVVGYSKSPSTTERARQLGVIDAAAPSALRAVSGSDLVLVAVPVGASEAIFKAIRHGIAEGALVMDVGSTKCDVVAAAQRGLEEKLPFFVPAHPIAGKELSGVEHAEADLFTGRRVILTPIKATRRTLVPRAEQVWTAVGGKVSRMTPETHDSAFAAVSHLPHLLAFASIQGIMAQPDGAQFLALAGPGFRDFSRIAAADPTMWRDVLLANRAQVLQQSQAFRAALDEMEALIATGDGARLEQLIAQASRTRAQWQLARP